MTWFLIAIIGPFLYAITNHIDKILLDRYFKNGGVGTLILVSSLLSILAVPIIFAADPTVLDVRPFHMFILAIVGLLNIAVLWFYLLALKDDEASVVIVFYQLVPVLGLLLGYFILHETLHTMQLIGMTIVILGTTIISFEIDSENRFRLRSATVGYMCAAAFCWAIESVIFKVVALEENVWRSLFWEHVMLVVVGVFIFATVASYRRNFLHALKTNSVAIIALNVLNEGLFMLGNTVVAFALLLAPVALVLLTESFQPIFVLAIGIALTVVAPRVTAERIEARHIWQKVLAIAITGIGTYILLFAT